MGIDQPIVLWLITFKQDLVFEWQSECFSEDFVAKRAMTAFRKTFDNMYLSISTKYRFVNYENVLPTHRFLNNWKKKGKNVLHKFVYNLSMVYHYETTIFINIV